jgi:tRNA-2-methylthio-N6-dimethylallyladenosine synthase
MFKYSRREHTKAFRWEETVSDEEKSRRLQAVIELQEEVSAEINRTMIGREVEVLVEGSARRRAGWLAGKTEHFKTAVFPESGAIAGDLVRVRVLDSTAHTLIGEAAAA